MRSTIVACAVLGGLLFGCAAPRAVTHGELAFAVSPPALRMGETRVLGRGVDPLVPLTASVSAGSVAVTFGRQGATTEVRLDPESMDTMDRTELPGAARGRQRDGVARVFLHGGAFVECSRRGSVEEGHRAVAQAFSAAGAPIGAPVELSAPEEDVIAAPRAASADGRRVLATFTVVHGQKFEVVAVPLEIL
jgi:hypothetical protein